MTTALQTFPDRTGGSPGVNGQPSSAYDGRPGELTGRQAGQHAAAAGAGHLVLTHLDPDYDPAPSVAEARDTFGGRIWIAAPGQVLDLS